MNIAEVEERVRGFMESLDRAVVEAVAGRPVSCSRGCAHCCYMVTECGIGEALYIAAEVARWPDWREVARALHRHAQEQTQRGWWGEEWFGRHVPCPLLTKANECRVYGRRPVACRCHLVRSPPENCALDAQDPHTERYDANLQAVPWAQRLDVGMFQDYGTELGKPFVGLLSHMVLFALRHVVRGGDLRWLEKRLGTLPTPRDWTERSVRQQFIMLRKGSQTP